MIETITVTSKSELRVSKSKRAYFTIGDEQDRTFVCFKPALHSDLEVGVQKVVDFNPPANEGDSYKLNNIAKEGEFPPKEASPKVGEIAPQERGMWWKELGECIRAKVFTKDTPEGFAARAAYFAEMFRVLNIKVEKPSKTS